MHNFKLSRCATFVILVLLPLVSASWKPIAGPSPNEFTQSISSGGGGHSSHSHVGDSSGTTITYHGNAFLDDHLSGHSNLLLGDSLGGISEGASEERILGGNKLFNDFYVEDTCNVDKYAFEHEGVIRYEHSLPKLEQLTICTWMRFTNHTGDHTLFTYSVDSEPREIQLWIANSKGASYITLAVHGQSLFRLNYPLKMRIWHHACASWNGKTGEWQLWVKGERIGRGFHNRLVNYVTKPLGVSFSGGPSINGPVAPDLHFEITMLQLYKVALSAGKAHRDHKHHHVHHFDHNGPISSTTPAPAPIPPNQPANSLLANGQIPTQVKINLAGAQDNSNPALPVQGIPSQLVGGAIQQFPAGTVTTQFVNGQFHSGSRILQEQLVAGNLLKQAQSQGRIIGQGPLPQQQQQQQQQNSIVFPGPSVAPSSYSEIINPANVRYVDGPPSPTPHLLYKRERPTGAPAKADKKINKRELVMLADGSIVDDSTIDSQQFTFDGLAQFADTNTRHNMGKRLHLEDEIREHDREPAEAEVQAVMSLCSKCQEEPFQGAIILAWKDIKVRIESALKAKTSGTCGKF